MTQFFGITWANPEYVWLLPVIILCVFLLLYRAQKKISAVYLLAGSHANMIKGFSRISTSVQTTKKDDSPQSIPSLQKGTKTKA